MFIVGTREANGNPAIFQVDKDTLTEAMQEVRDAMIESGVENPVVLGCIQGSKKDVQVDIDPEVA